MTFSATARIRANLGTWPRALGFSRHPPTAKGGAFRCGITWGPRKITFDPLDSSAVHGRWWHIIRKLIMRALYAHTPGRGSLLGEGSPSTSTSEPLVGMRRASWPRRTTCAEPTPRRRSGTAFGTHELSPSGAFVQCNTRNCLGGATSLAGKSESGRGSGRRRGDRTGPIARLVSHRKIVGDLGKRSPFRAAPHRNARNFNR